jgi:hypothetical protein
MEDGDDEPAGVGLEPTCTVAASGKNFQEGLLFRQIPPFGFGRNRQGRPRSGRAAKRREGEETKGMFLLLLSRPSWKFFPEALLAVDLLIKERRPP